MMSNWNKKLGENRKCSVCENILDKNHKSVCDRKCQDILVGRKNSIRMKGKPVNFECKPRSEETKQKLRDNAKNNPNFGMKGKTHSEKTKIKMREAKLGILMPNEFGEIVSKALKGRKLTEEHKKKISENNSKFWLGKNLSEKQI